MSGNELRTETSTLRETGPNLAFGGDAGLRETFGDLVDLRESGSEPRFVSFRRFQKAAGVPRATCSLRGDESGGTLIDVAKKLVAETQNVCGVRAPAVEKNQRVSRVG